MKPVTLYGILGFIATLANNAARDIVICLYVDALVISDTFDVRPVAGLLLFDSPLNKRYVFKTRVA